MIRHRVVALLGIASGLDYAAQVVVPILLVRVLSAHDFGGYRLLWLAAQTCALVLSLSIAPLLVSQVSQQPPNRKGALFGNAFAYLACTAVLVALMLSPLTPFAQRLFAGGPINPWLLPLFSALWLVSLPFDQVGLACNRPSDQALLTLGLAVLRVISVVAAALAWRSLAGVGAALILVAGIRVVVALIYASRRSHLDGGRGLVLDGELARQQLRGGLGFGSSFALNGVRLQADGWVAALRFDPVAVATLGIAQAAAPLTSILRMAFTNTALPVIAADVAAGRIEAAIAVNRHANLMVAALLFPMTGMLFALADPLLTFVFTARFGAAVLPFRIYCVGLLAAALESTTLIIAIGAAAFSFRQGVILAPLAAAACYWGASAIGDPTLGLSGIAIGAVVVGYIFELWNLVYVKRALGLSWKGFQAWTALGGLLLVNLGATLFTLWIIPTVPTAWPTLLRLIAGGAAFVTAALVLGVGSPRVRQVYIDMLGVAPGTRGVIPS